MKILKFACMLLASTAGMAVAKEKDGLHVATTYGPIRGTTESGVRAFLGIPYAAPPVGDGRWKAPQALTSWTDVRAADHDAPICYQGQPHAFGPFSPEFMTGSDMSEDCLYLNVWAPNTASSKALPVFFYIHGGGFGSGSGTIPVYRGAKLAARGAVVVTINYRLGAFGFLAHPALTAEGGSSGNYGVMDMTAALRWAHDNIDRFGGDPQNVTIAGQSAGAGAVNALQFAPSAKGLFHRVVAQSGSGEGFPEMRLAQAEGMGLLYQKKLGADGLSAMRTLPPQQVYSASVGAPPSVGGGVNIPAVRFAPNVDGKILLGSGGNTGENIQSVVPQLTGFTNSDAFGRDPDNITPDEFVADVRRRFGAMAERILALYPHANPDQALSSNRKLARDSALFRMDRWAVGRTAKVGQPIYMYLFDQPYPPITGQKAYGAFHTAEVPYVFGNLGLGDRQFTKADWHVADVMGSFWLSFMRSGNPSYGAYQWPRAGKEGAKIMVISPQSHLRGICSNNARCQALTDFVRSGGKLSIF